MVGARRRAVRGQAESGADVGHGWLKLGEREVSVSVLVELSELALHKLTKHLFVLNQLHYIRTINYIVIIIIIIIIIATTLGLHWMLWIRFLVSLVMTCTRI